MSTLIDAAKVLSASPMNKIPTPSALESSGTGKSAQELVAMQDTTKTTEQVDAAVPQNADAKSSEQQDNLPEAPTGRQSLALLAKKEAQARAREKELSARIFQAEQAAKVAEARANEYAQKWDTLKKKPYEVLDQEVGHDWYQNATRHILGQKQSPEEEMASLRDNVSNIGKTVKEQIDEALKMERAQFAEQQRQEQAVKEYTDSIKELINTNEEFEFTKNSATGLNDVITLVGLWHQKYGEVLTPEEATRKIEQQYEEQAKAYAKTQKWAKINGATKQSSTQAQKSQSARTLTSELKTTPANGAHPNSTLSTAAQILAAHRQHLLQRDS